MTAKQQFIADLAEQVIKQVEVKKKEVLTLTEASQYTGLSVSTLYKYCAAGKIAHSKPSGKRPIYFALADLNDWMMSRRTESEANLERHALTRRAS